MLAQTKMERLRSWDQVHVMLAEEGRRNATPDA